MGSQNRNPTLYIRHYARRQEVLPRDNFGNRGNQKSNEVKSKKHPERGAFCIFEIQYFVFRISQIKNFVFRISHFAKLKIRYHSNDTLVITYVLIESTKAIFWTIVIF